MKIFFRMSELGFGGAEKVFISVASELQLKFKAEIIFVVDHMAGENVAVAQGMGFSVIPLNVSRTLNSILPLAKLINLQRPDIIISAFTDTNAACLLSKVIASYKVPVIVSEHASLNEHWQSFSNLKKKILTFYVSWIYKLADKVLCVSKGLEQQVNSLLKQPNKTLTIYNPVRFKECVNKKVNNSGTLNLVAVGRVVPQKDYATLIKAIAFIKKQGNVQLKIVGGTTHIKEYEKVKALVEDLQLADNIEFIGYSDAVENHYENADIFVLSSAWEGFGNVIVEAMAFGLPIVSTNCNYGPSEILENGKYGRLADVGDSEAIANLIITEANTPLVTSETLINRSKDFSEDIIANQYYALINGVIKT
jgi:glycosyltransferase involved in cell wall biosynthesis